MSIIQKHEGEYFTDQAVNPIPAKDTWPDLTVNELIDVQLQLEEKLYVFAQNKTIAPVVREAIAQIKALIASRA